MNSTATTANLAAEQSAGCGPAARARGWLSRLAGDSLLQKSALSVFDQGVVSGTSFATSVILGRLATKEDLGVYYLALSIVFFVRGIQEQLVSAPFMIYAGRRQGVELDRYAGSALTHQCMLMLVTSGILAVLAIAGVLPTALHGAIWLLLCAAPVLLVREFVRQFLFAHLEMKAAIGLDVSVAGLQLLGLSVLAFSDKLTVLSTLAVLAASSGVPVVIWLATKRQRLIATWNGAVRDFWHNWTFARWALASQLLACTTPYAMPWVVALTHGEAETGTLGACATLVGLSNMFMIGLCNFLSPKAARAFGEGGLPELQSVLRKTALLFAVSLGAICFVGFAFGEQIAVAVYGGQFAGTGLVIGVLSLSVLANSMGVTAGNGLWAMERPSANFVADCFSLCIVIISTTALVPLWGPLGAALATFAGTSSDAAVRLFILRQTMREMSPARSSVA